METMTISEFMNEKKIQNNRMYHTLFLVGLGMIMFFIFKPAAISIPAFKIIAPALSI